MKKMLVLAAVAIATTPAFASKARLQALQSPAHTSDTRDVFKRPDQALVHGEFVTLEVGPGSDAAVTDSNSVNAEGGFVRKLGESSALGAYLGNKLGLAHSSLSLSTAYSKANKSTIQNPLNLYYANKMGDMTWGLGLQYSSSDIKSVKSKSSTMGLNASATGSVWNAQLALGLTGEATAIDTNKIEQKAPVAISGGYSIDTLYVYAGYEMYGAKDKVIATEATTETDVNNITVGLVDSRKKDGTDFYYGVSYVASTTKVKDGTKTETTSLPLIVGIEAEANSWLVVRGSITQSVLLGTTKTTPANATATEDSLADNTKVAGGLGLKLGKFTVDGTLAGAATGHLGSDDKFLANLGLTYKF